MLRRCASGLLFLTLLAFVSFAHLHAEPQSTERSPIYSRTTTYPPLRMSYKDIAALLSKVETLTLSANAAWEPDSFAQNLKIQQHGTELSYWGLISGFNLAKAPPLSESLTYNYRHARAPFSDAPILSVALTLQDEFRFLVVEGRSAEHVDALVSTVSESLESHAVLLGGQSFPILFGWPTLVALLVLGALSLFVRLSRRHSVVLTSAILALAVCSVLVNSRTLFPGFVAYSGDVSFIVRNAASISFWSFVLTVLSFASWILLSRPWQQIVRIGEKPNQGVQPPPGARNSLPESGESNGARRG